MALLGYEGDIKQVALGSITLLFSQVLMRVRLAIREKTIGNNFSA